MGKTIGEFSCYIQKEFPEELGSFKESTVAAHLRKKFKLRRIAVGKKSNKLNVDQIYRNTVCFSSLTATLLRQNRLLVFVDGFSFCPTDSMGKFLGNSDLRPFTSRLNFSSTLFFVIGVSSHGDIFIQHYRSAPGFAEFHGFLRGVADELFDRIVESGFKAHIFLDQHSGFRNIVQQWKENRLFVFHMSPRKQPWNNLAEYAIGKVKNTLRSQQFSNSNQVLDKIREELRSWSGDIFLRLQSIWLKEVIKLANLLEDLINAQRAAL